MKKIIITILLLLLPAISHADYGDPKAHAIKLSTKNFNGNLNGSDINVQLFADKFDDLSLGSGGSIDISSDTNLSVTSPIILTGDTLSLGTVDVSSNTNLTVSSPLGIAGDNIQITGAVDVSAHTNLAVSAPIVLTGDTLSVTQSSGSTNGYLSSTDWNTFNGKQANLGLVAGTLTNGKACTYTSSGTLLTCNTTLTTGTVTSVATSNGLTGGTITSTGTISGVDAIADGSTKGVSSYTAADFNSSTGNISIDYTNGQAAATGAKGFLTSTDWNTFNGKESALTISTGLTRTTNTITNNLSTGVSGGQSVTGGTGSGDDLTITSTTNGTKGNLFFGTLSTYDEVNDRFGIGQTAPTADLQITAAGLGTTYDASTGIRLTNSTNAAAGAQQISPPLTFVGNGWKTTGGASENTIWVLDALPVQGAAAITGALRVRGSDSGGAFATRLSISNASSIFTVAGNIDATIGSTGFTFGGFNFALANAGSSTTSGMSYGASGSSNTNTASNRTFHTFNGGFSPASGTVTNTFMELLPVMNWGGTPGAGSYEIFKINVTETAVPSGAKYLARWGTGGGSFTEKFSVTSAGAVTAASTLTSNTTIRLKGYTVATLPAGTVGDTAYATDLLTPTYLVAAVGGGAVVGPVFYNGAAWVSY